MIKSIVGNLNVIHSETVHLSEGRTLTVSLDDTLFFEFVFSGDETGKTNIKTSITNDNKLVVNCINFNNSLGEGILSPVNIGKYQGKQLLLTFFVWTPDSGQGKRIFNYCLYHSND